ncbi:hypothetical protein KUTeg_016957 [Tegillarca granosa]|uniref:Apple domain-containing protein n=1 Tax=Tegillarca granosa TaxID=220873 RepID=A0ABQ9EMC4_TEGGR|nr:hypothetical protein KUTeg_016957 [Tegillarca granosa]
MKHLYGRVLKWHVIQEFSTKFQVTQCAMECFRMPNCKSFNFEKRHKLCQLNNATHVDFPQHFYHENQQEVEYHLKEAFSIQDEKVKLEDICPQIVFLHRCAYFSVAFLTRCSKS